MKENAYESKRPPVMNNKSICIKMQSGSDNKIYNKCITMHLTAYGDDLL